MVDVAEAVVAALLASRPAAPRGPVEPLRRLVEHRLRLLALLHQLQLGVLQLALTAGQGAELVLQRLQFARRPGARVEPRPVAVGPGPYLLDVLLQPGDVAVEVVDGDLGPDPLVVERGQLAGEPVQLGELGQVRAPMGELGQRRVDRLQVEQATLGLRVCLHGCDSFVVARCGTVRHVRGPDVGDEVGDDGLDRRASARSSRGEHVEPRPLGRPVGGVEQRRPAAGEVFARRMVAQVGGEVGVDTGGRGLVEERVAGAADDRERRASARVRIARRHVRPPAVAGSRPRDVSGELGQRHRPGQAGRPGPGAARRVSSGRTSQQTQPGGEGVGDARDGRRRRWCGPRAARRRPG